MLSVKKLLRVENVSLLSSRSLAVVKKVYRLKVRNDRALQQFFIEVPLEDPDPPARAFIEYKQLSCNQFELLKTCVPQVLEGRGFDESMATTVFKHLAEKEVCVRLKCPYLKNIFDKVAYGNTNMRKYISKDRY